MTKNETAIQHTQFHLEVLDTSHAIDINQSYDLILEELKDITDDTVCDEWFYFEASTTEVLFCRCLNYLKSLIAFLLIEADKGSPLAKAHIAKAQDELEWEFSPNHSLDEDGFPFLGSDGSHGFYLRNPSAAAIELWEANL